MNVIKIAAFSNANQGGNPAGVVLAENGLPSNSEMQSIAHQVNFSETVFATRLNDDKKWRVRYFSPESEVPFCGHATIALGSVLAREYGENIYTLNLNDTQITVEGSQSGELFSAALQSPSTSSQALDNHTIKEVLKLFDYDIPQLDQRLSPARIHGGADHFFFALKSREDLATMNYGLSAGRELMRAHNIVTIMFVYRENDQLFHVRNAFASGGVLEDPATGAAAAAFSGYLRDIKWNHGGEIHIIQGEDMGAISRITTQFNPIAGESIRVSGQAREIE